MATDPSRFSDRIDQGLFNAIAEGNLELTKSYVEQGANLKRAMDPEGRQNPLRLAAIRSHFDIVKYLVEEKNVKPGQDARVMHMVIMAEKNAKEMFTYLAQHGGNVNAVDKVLGTPLMISLREKGLSDLTKFLVEDMKADVAFITPQKSSAVHLAAETSTLECLEYLLQHGGDKLLTELNEHSYTPLIAAAAKGKDDMVEFLVHKYKCDVNDTREVNALLMAVQYRRVSTVNLLLKLGADPNIKQKETQATALHLAASNNFLDIVDALIAHGATVDITDPRGYTPLLMAGTEGYTTCCRKLLEAGADVHNRASSDNATAIFHCANKNRVEVVRLLLEYGANPLDTRNEKNETLEQISRAEGRNEMANLLAAWVATFEEPSERVKLCAVCQKYEKGQQKRCTRCKVRWYCSAECQKKDWPDHKFHCKLPEGQSKA